MDILGIAGLLVSVLSGFATWYWGTKKKRLIRAIERQESEIQKVKGYISNTGYKLLLKDFFHAISYSLSMVFFAAGASIFSLTIFSYPELKTFLAQVLSGIMLGAGLVMFDMFRVLSKTLRSRESIEAMNQKLERMKSEHEKI